MIELDKSDPIIEELLPFLSHKVPKTIAATLVCFTQIYHAFGCKTVDPKPVLKALTKVFGHADKNVRAESQNLAVEMYRWLRDGMKPLFWNDLKEIQQNDLEKLFEPIKSEPAPKQERLLRSQQAKAEAAAAAAPAVRDEAGAEEDEVEEAFEPELMTIDVFPKIPKDFGERMASSKWKDRKDALDELQTAINVPAIEPGPFDDICRALGKSMKDSNIAVVTVAANCIELLAKGLRKDFTKYKNHVLDPILERLKERKQSVVDALAAAADAVISATGLSSELEHVLTFLTHKNPQVKLESTRLLTRCLKSTKDAPSIPETKLLADNATKLLGDAQPNQREAAADVLGVLLKIMGDRIMNTHLDSLDDSKKAKVKEIAGAAEVRAKYKPKAAPAPKAAAPPPSAKKHVAKKPSGAARKAPPPQPASPEPIEDPAPALQSKPTARPGTSRLGGPAGAGRGIRPPSGIGMPGKKLPAPGAGPTPVSPKRPARLPTPTEEEPPPPQPKTAPRGLTGRPLSRPAAAPAEPPTPVQPPAPAFDPAKEAELDDLRVEVEKLRASNEQWRADQAKMSSQINELQNQNAQLIEDHTRDVLSIKAKETQLVRARSEAESAEQTSSQLQREVERLKRELGRIGRANSPRPETFASANDIFPDMNGRTPSANRHSVAVSPSGDGKENLGSWDNKRLSPPSSRPGSVAVPPMRSNSARGIGSPVRPQSMYRPQQPPPRQPQAGSGPNDGAYTDSDTRSSGASSGSRDFSGGPVDGNGVETWKRAAEVTQNLKARIELMKARQGIGK